MFYQNFMLIYGMLYYHFCAVCMRSINWIYVQFRGWCFLSRIRVCQESNLNVLAAVNENFVSTLPNVSSAVFLQDYEISTFFVLSHRKKRGSIKWHQFWFLCILKQKYQWINILFHFPISVVSHYLIVSMWFFFLRTLQQLVFWLAPNWLQ